MAKRKKPAPGAAAVPTKKSAPTISLAMMVKNEEKMLPRALESAKPWVDEIIVVDTGSTDRTVEIAQSYGAKIYHHPWEYSFSKHRNQSIGYCTGDWVMILDADEELDQETAPMIRELVKNTRVNCFLFRLYNDVSSGGNTFLMHPRLFRNHVGFHYEGTVHNSPTIPGLYDVSEVKLYHYGYNLDPETMAAKHQRRIDMLSKAIENDPTEFKLHAYLAQSLASDPKTWDEALEYSAKAVELASEQGMPGSDFPRCYFPMLGVLFAQKRWDELRRKCLECLDRMPNYPDPYLFLTHTYANNKDWEKTAEAARKFFMMQDMAEAKQADWLFAEIHTTGQFGQVYRLWVLALGHLGQDDYALSVFGKLLELDRCEAEVKSVITHAGKEFSAGLTMALAEAAAPRHPEWAWLQDLLPRMRDARASELARQARDEGLAALESGDAALAAEKLSWALEGLSTDPEVHLGLAKLALARGDAAAGRRHLVSGLNLHPGHPWAWRALAELALAAGEHAGAATYLERYAQMAPGDQQAAAMLADCRRRSPADNGPTVAQQPPKLLVLLVPGLSPAMVRELAPHFVMHQAWGETLPGAVDARDTAARWEGLYTGSETPLRGGSMEDHPGLAALGGADIFSRMAAGRAVGLMSIPLGSPAPGGFAWSVAGYPQGPMVPGSVLPESLLPLVLAGGYRGDFVLSQRELDMLDQTLAGKRMHLGRLLQVERNKIKQAMAMPAVDVLALGLTGLDWVHRCFNMKDPRCFAAYQHLYAVIETCLACLRPANVAVISQAGYDEMSMAPSGGGFYYLSWHKGENAKAPVGDIAAELVRLATA